MSTIQPKTNFVVTKKNLAMLIIVSAMGYFVDAYDLIIFSAVRSQSLADLGISSAASLSTGLALLNFQMAGLLIGGIIFGAIGDKRGRLTVLFGSIFLYSVANILNGFVDAIWQYKVLRFIAGFGLAGELGAGISIVSEVMSKEGRGIGTMLVGISSAIRAVAVCRDDSESRAGKERRCTARKTGYLFCRSRSHGDGEWPPSCRAEDSEV